MFEQISKVLGLEYKLYTPPYHSASNGRIEGFHAFLKACIAKHVAPQLEWDVLIPLACAAYNLLGPKMRYLGTNLNVLSLEALKYMF